jgi:hypothetical protein
MGKNSKWIGRAAFYAPLASLITWGLVAAGNAGAPIVSDNGNPNTGMSSQQEARIRSQMGQMTPEERRRAFETPSDTSAWKNKPKTSDQERMQAHAQNEAARLEAPGPQPNLPNVGLTALALLGAVGAFSRMAKKRTGLSIPDHFHGPRSYAEEAYNLGVHGEKTVDLRSIKQKARHEGDWRLRGVGGEIAQTSEQAIAREVPYQWFGTLRGWLGGDRVDVKHVPDPTKPKGFDASGNVTGYDPKEVAVPKPGETRGEIFVAKQRNNGPSTP